MNKHALIAHKLTLAGLAFGVIIGMIVFGAFLNCASSLPTNPAGSGWCSDETAEQILSPAFLPTIAFALLLNAGTGYDLLESSEAVFNVIFWMFGVGIYGSIGILIGWIMSKIYFFSKHYVKNQ